MKGQRLVSRVCFLAGLALGVVLGSASADARRARAEVAAQAWILDSAAVAETERGSAAGWRTAIPRWLKAGELYGRARDRGAQVVAWSDAGLAYQEVGRPDSALLWLRRALSVSRAGRGVKRSVILNNLAYVHDAMGRTDSALAYYDSALYVSRRAERGRGAGETLLNVGYVHRNLGQLDSAAAYFRRALNHYRRNGDVAGEGMARNVLGMYYNDVGRQQQLAGNEAAARAWYGRAAAEYGAALRASGAGGDTVMLATVLNNVGVLHRWLRRPDSALAFYGRALALQARTGDTAGMAMVTHNVGLVREDLRESAAANAAFRHALSLWRRIGNPRGEGETLYELGHLALRGGAVPDPQTASAYFDSASTRLASLAHHAGSDPNRLSLVHHGWHGALFGEWVLAELAGVPAGDAPYASLAAAEQGRTQALRLLMTGSRAPAEHRGGTLVSEGRRLAAEAARGRTAVLSYFWASDTLVGALYLPSGRAHLFRRPVADTVLQYLAGTLSLQLRSVADNRWRHTAGVLAALLLPPDLEARVPPGSELLVVPHGPLHVVPFVVLPSADGVLGDRYDLRYTPSLAVVSEIESRPASAPTRRALVVGDPQLPPRTGRWQVQGELPRLSGAREEARSIAESLGVAAVTGAQAREHLVRQRLSHTRIVHLATHGRAFTSPGRTRDSHVVLAAGNGHDGFLTAGEVLDEVPFIAADLVVLSGCETGLGDLRASEGTVGLQRAFLARGAHTLIVSYWKVPDASTRRLFELFYAHWRGGMSKSGALRRAQQDLREQGLRHPLHWAGFQVVGAD